MSTHNPMISEPGNTEMLRSPEEQIRNLIVEMIEDFWNDLEPEGKKERNEMKTSIQTINNN